MRRASMHRRLRPIQATCPSGPMDQKSPSDIQPALTTRAEDVIRIGRCEIRPATGELVRDDTVVLLGRRALNLLLVLAEAEGSMVTNDTLLKRVWAGSVVEQNTLQSHVSSLRKALGPDRERLKTYSGRGYLLQTGSSDATRTAVPLSAPETSLLTERLPTSPSTLIGRESAVASLRSLLRQPGVITLTGPGGIGKTRLGLEAARFARDEFPGGVYFVDLASVVDPNDVIPAVLSSIGTEHFHASIEDRARGLGREASLVMIDNCEHVVEVAAVAAEAIVRSNDAVTVLATSRETLRVDGESVFVVPPLDLPEPNELGTSTLLECSAAQLFFDRSGTSRARFLEDESVGTDIVRICRRLDGNPLAIELAAARADSIGIEEVATRLDDSLSILVDGRRTALPRHQTLRATLAWSYGLLNDNERKVFRRLAVFAGGFTLASACQVVAGGEFSEGTTLDLISGLINKSLVANDFDWPRRRWRLLETTRAYALEQLLESGELASVAKRHVLFLTEAFDASALATNTELHRFALGCFLPEIDNARAALNWALSSTGDAKAGFALASAVAPLMYELLLLDECAATASRALDSSGLMGAPPMQELRIRTAMAASLVYVRGPTSATIAMWTDVLALSRELQAPGFELRAIWGLWTCWIYSGFPALALHYAEEYRTFLDHHPDERAAPRWVERVAGIAHHYLGNHAAAQHHLELFISRYEHGNQLVPLGNLIDHATLARASLARALWFSGLVDRAAQVVERAATEAVVGNNPLTICYVIVECALPLSLLQEDRPAARRYLFILRTAAERHGSMFWKLLDQCYAALLEPEVNIETLTRLRRGIDGLHALAFDTYSVDLRNRLAHLLHGAGRRDEALALTNRTLERLRAQGEPVWEPEILRTRALLTLESGMPEATHDAHADLISALNLARQQGALSLELRVATALAPLLASSGRTPEAKRLLEDVCGRFVEGLHDPALRNARALAQSFA